MECRQYGRACGLRKSGMHLLGFSSNVSHHVIQTHITKFLPVNSFLIQVATGMGLSILMTKSKRTDDMICRRKGDESL